MWECIWSKGGGGGIYSIHLFDHRLCSCCYKICIEKGQPGKMGLAIRGSKGGAYSIHLFDHRLGSPFLL